MSDALFDTELDKFFKELESSEKKLKLFVDFNFDNIEVGVFDNFVIPEMKKKPKEKKRKKKIGIDKKNNKNSLF
jgi:hypothetical protein